MKIILSLALLSTLAFAGELNDYHVVTNHVYAIDVGDIVSAKIVKEKNSTHVTPNGKYSSSVAVLEIVAKVQGNICGADPITVAVERHYQVPVEDPKISTQGIRLSYSQQNPDPYSLVQNACFLVSKPRTIKIPITISGFAVNEEIDVRRFLIFTGELTGPFDPKFYKTIETTFNNLGVWTVVIK